MKKETMGAFLAARRKELGMTQAELAEKMGVTDKAVSKWERDLSCPDVDALPRLAEIFGVTVDDLLRARARDTRENGKHDLAELLGLILKAICLAAGVAVAVLSVLRKIDSHGAFTLLGIGLACAGLVLFQREKE